MNKNERIECIINALCDGNKSQFARLLGVKPQTINTWIARDTFDIERVYSCCGKLNPHWLLTGEGEMLKSDATDQSNAVSHLNVQGGELNVTQSNTNSADNETVKTLRTLLAEKERTIQIQQQLISELQKRK